MINSTTLWLMLLALFGFSYATNASAENSPGMKAPPRVCEIRQETWCIFASNITIENQPGRLPDYRTSWKFWGSHWVDFPAVIHEPKGCRSGTSDTVELLHFQPNFQWNGRKWNSIDVRLKRDGSCDLKLLSPSLKDEPTGAAQSAILTLVRACRTTSCDGPVLGETISYPLQKKN